MDLSGVYAPVTLTLFMSLYWVTLLALVLLIRGRAYFSLTYWWELTYATPTGGATVVTLLVLLFLSGLPPFPTFFAKLGMLSHIYSRGGVGVLVLVAGVIGVGWVAYVGAMLLLLGGRGLVISPPWSQVYTSYGVRLGFVIFFLLLSLWGLGDLLTLLRWLWA
jgi:NADH:ubiquinone oxidoreductase subunit 2 (subunit N)